MLWTWFGYSASEVLSAFAQRRMDERIRSSQYQGVSSPSQIRYVNYIEEIVRKGIDYTSPAQVLIKSVKIHTLPLYKRKSIRISFIIQSLGTIQYDYAKRYGLALLSKSSSTGKANLDQDEFNFETDGTLVSGDVTIRFYSFDDNCSGPFEFAELGPGARTIRYGNIVGKQLCFVTFHTAFHKDSRTFHRAEVDGVYDRSASHFMDNFAISFTCNNGEADDLPTRARIISLSLSEGKQGEVSLPLALLEATSDIYGPLDCPSEKYEGFSIPYGGTPGQRLLHVQNVFEKIFKLSSNTQPLKFRRGEIMHGSVVERNHERSLFMIISGSAEYTTTSSEDLIPPWRINRGDSLHGFTLGAGDCYGVLSFLLGRDEDPRSFCICASSDCVEVHVSN